MKIVFALTLCLTLTNSAFALDQSELGGELYERVMAGCEKYAAKKTEAAKGSYFNMNGWAGGNIGAGSVMEMEKDAEIYKQFINVECQNMMAEILELKLGWGPWQK